MPLITTGIHIVILIVLVFYSRPARSGLRPVPAAAPRSPGGAARAGPSIHPSGPPAERRGRQIVILVLRFSFENNTQKKKQKKTSG